MIYLREATESDIDILFQWANDPVVRQNSFHTEQIPYETHRKWFAKVLSDSNVRQYIIMSDDETVGQIRLNVDNDEAEISYSVSSSCRGKGIGRTALCLIAEEARMNFPQVSKLVAKVKPDNVASKHLFESEGYQTEYYCYTIGVNDKCISDDD